MKTNLKDLLEFLSWNSEFGNRDEKGWGGTGVPMMSDDEDA
jgi:hypothetical protein